MIDVVAHLAGGIGLFLLGMSLMTDSLKDMAGDTLRLWLAKFTGSIYKALFSGIGFTLLVQSSTATTLATIGFVSAGVLTFSQAIGVIIGANIGTTSTGWMVALLGVKFSITNIALPLIALGAILKLLTHGRVALFGLCIAGFGLIFIGIDQLQWAMAGFSEQVDLSIFTTTSFISKLFLVLIGLVMTVLLQSSSAAITTTLAALATGVVNLEQTFMLVIGQNIGTVATAVLAALGASVSAKRTAAVHVIFNIVSAVFAFFFLAPGFVWLYETSPIFSTFDQVLIIAAFHTAFSVLGALLFLPLLNQFEMLICRLIPEKAQNHIQYLDQASLEVPTLAIAAAERVLYLMFHDQFIIFKKALQDGVLVSAQKLKAFDVLMTQLDQYLEQIELSELKHEQEKMTDLLRLVVYARVFRSDLEDLDYAVLIRTQPTIYQVALDYVHMLDAHIDDLFLDNKIEKADDFQQELLHLKLWTDTNRQENRNKIVEYAALNHLSAAKNLELLASQRWLERLIAHSQRLANVLKEKSRLNSFDDERV